MGKAAMITVGCLAIGLCVAPVVGQVAPQSPPVSGFGWGAGRAFNQATTESVQGQILDVQSVPSAGSSQFTGLHLTVQTASGPLVVHAGPEWYLRNQNVMFAPGDEVTVTGSRVTWSGQPALIATSIQRGDVVIQLRNAYGVPGWSGYGPGGRGRGRGLGPSGTWGRGWGRGLGAGAGRWWGW
jgi:hypothetical protein